MNKRVLLFVSATIIILIILSQSVLAHCPLCTAAAGVGIGVARWIGVDDSIVGLFLGAFIVSMGLWFNNLLKKRKANIPFQGFLIVFASFLLTIIPLYLAGIINNLAIVKSLPELSVLGLEYLALINYSLELLLGLLRLDPHLVLVIILRKKRARVYFLIKEFCS